MAESEFFGAGPYLDIRICQSDITGNFIEDGTQYWHSKNNNLRPINAKNGNLAVSFSFTI
jgi:hypothetical protein